ncbi:protease pro-enzyme activation domain-containing protein [Leekyejoonella antrihumi]|uniref:Peptidase S53 activation domain-containing protein n=1 Tax=Leekyejoonella antrihumi TaxID=1660198 RepID=A0A563E6Q5_9MICO|nr:protease pro-enzyme activation domain-containing protein [Leekyejoonella antrihumi]TWP38220.1 hypothetical protein FGL98_03050 [Leekyejoonella antrihumi]
MEQRDDAGGVGSPAGRAHSDAELVPLGEVPEPRPGDQPAGRPDPAARLTVTIYLKLPDTGVPEVSTAVVPSPEVVMALADRASGCGLTVEAGVAPEAVRLSGAVSAVECCFGVRLTKWRTAEGPLSLVPDGPVRLPRTLAGHVVAVLGLDTRPVAHRRG